MRVLLINPPDIGVIRNASKDSGKTVRGRFASTEAPLGLAYVAAALEAAYIDVQVIDSVGLALSRSNIADEIAKTDPDLIGITTLTATLQSAIKLAEMSKEVFPKVPIVLGGHGAFMIEKEILERSRYIDIIVKGEGEDTIVELSNSIKTGRSLGDIAGIVFKSQKNDIVETKPRPFRQDLDSIPLPARHLLPMENYIVDYMPRVLGKESFKGTPLISSRGCPFQCVFCASSNFSGHKWRPRSPENVVFEIDHLYQKYGKLGLNGFSFSDDNFTQDEHRVIDICNLMKERGLSKLRWCCEARVDVANEAVYLKMYEAGCRFVAFGIESGNEDILRRIKKGITREMVKKAVKTAKNVGMKTWGYFLLGLPDDTEKTMKDTVEFAYDLGLDVPVFHAAYVYPGTTMGKERSFDWMEFLVEEELSNPSYHIAGFHPCVPTYADREKMKTVIRDVMAIKPQRKGFIHRIVSKLYNQSQ